MEHIVSWLGVGITVLINVVTVAYLVGSNSTKLKYLETHISKQEDELKELRLLHAEIGVLKNKLDNLHDCLKFIQRALSHKGNLHHEVYAPGDHPANS